MTGQTGRTGRGPETDQDREVDEALALVSRPPAPAPDPEHATVPAPKSRTGATPWAEARAVAARAGRGTALRTHRVPLGQALGQVLAEPLDALTDLPSFDTSAMDGWAVAGPGPWSVKEGGGVLAGHAA
ncbi:MAG TPA: molybdopterin molybdenumtransferase MoeA, partial [Streptomyces sp.]|nr:molybdopterin molybdenumtransferase MoeA [Streptomyces sp.]